MVRDLRSEESARLMMSWLVPTSMVKSSSALWISASKLALIFWMLLYTEVEANDQFPEIEALLEFEAAVSTQTGSVGNPFEPRGYWDSWKRIDRDPCNWVGVSCTSDSKVQAIDLSGWGLTKLYGFGSLSTLESLERLDLSSNNFNADIYEDIGTLTGLTHLDLSASSFEGVIPKTIGHLWNLRYLSLAGNRLRGEIPRLDNLTKLQVLSLAQNQLTGIIPDLGNLTTLVSLDLSNNLLNGSIPVLENLTNLLDLNLNNNTLTDFKDPQLPAPKNVKHLVISGNHIVGDLPPGLVDLHYLEVLDLSCNGFSGRIPNGLSRQTNHSFWLDLSHNNLTGDIPEDLFQPQAPSSVMSLNLSYNLLTGSIPVVKPSDFAGWFFDILDLSHNRLSGSIPPMLLNSSEIHLLWLQDNQLDGNIVDMLDRFPYTRELRMENNLFTGDLTRMVGRWGSLALRMELVDISNNLLYMSKTEEYPDPMRATLEAFVAMFALREFRIAGNNLVEISLPSAFLRVGNLPTLEVLDLSNNHLVGTIAAEAFDSETFPVLKALNISSNNLTGPIPLSITRLPKLISFDVSSNNLSGELPAIPANSSLWNADRFSGNPGLCGGPLPPCPSPPPAPITFVIIQKNANEGLDLSWWLLLIIVASAVLVPLAGCVIVLWRWRVYKTKHQQDADMIATSTLLERDTAELMPLRELKRATDNFADGAQIGAGGFGTVYTGKLNDGTMVAIKRSKREGSEDDKQRFLNEVRILSQVNHRYLVKLLGCCMENKGALLVFEYISNGTLQEHLQGKNSKGARRLTWKQRLHIAVQTADALNYLHSATSPPIFHRDVKSANILLDENLNAKVADFGISKLAPLEATHVSSVAIQGTMGYVDPEYYTNFQLTSKSDVYSFGVVLLELISAQPAIDFQRGPGDASLVTFAASHIRTGDLKGLIDPVLMKSGDYQAEKDSIMSVGNFALKCVEMRSKDRPDMKVVWKQLQTLWLKLHGNSDSLESILFELPDADEKISDSLDSSTVLYSSLQDGPADSCFQQGDIEMSRSF